MSRYVVTCVAPMVDIEIEAEDEYAALEAALDVFRREAAVASNYRVIQDVTPR